MRKQNVAWVSGIGGAYVLHVVEAPVTREFHHLNSIPFTDYRAAQAIANAIKAHVAKVHK